MSSSDQNMLSDSVEQQQRQEETMQQIHLPTLTSIQEDVKMSGVTPTHKSSDTSTINRLIDQVAQLTISVEQSQQAMRSMYQQQRHHETCMGTPDIYAQHAQLPYPPLPYLNQPYYQPPSQSHVHSNTLPPSYMPNLSAIPEANEGVQTPTASPPLVNFHARQGTASSSPSKSLRRKKDEVDVRRRTNLLRDAPNFEGEPHEDVDLYLRLMYRYFQAVGIRNPAERFDLMFWSLKGKAQRFIQSLMPPPSNTLEIETRLRKRFSKTIQQKLDKFEAAKQSSSQDISDFGDSLRVLSHGTEMSEQAIIRKFIHSLYDQRVAPYLITTPFTILEDAVEAASRIHTALASSRSNRFFKTNNNNNSTGKTSVTGSTVKSTPMSAKQKGKCFNCNKPGHLSKDCPLKKRKPGSKQVNEVEGDADSESESIQDDILECQQLEESEQEEDPPSSQEDDDNISIQEIEVNVTDLEVDVAHKSKQKSQVYGKKLGTQEGVKKGAPKRPPSPPKGKEVVMKNNLPNPPKILTKPPSYISVNSSGNHTQSRTSSLAKSGQAAQASQAVQRAQSSIISKPSIISQPLFSQNQIKQNQVRYNNNSQQRPAKSSISQSADSQPKHVKYQAARSAPLFPECLVENSQMNSTFQPNSRQQQQSVQRQQLKNQQHRHTIVPPARPAVFPDKVERAKVIRTKEVEITKALSTPVQLPLQVQLGLLMIASKDSKQLVSRCLQSAKQAIEQLEINSLEVSEVQQQARYTKGYRQTLYLQCLVDNKPCYGLVDSGAQISVITSALAGHLGLDQSASKENSSGFSVVGFNGAKSSTARILVSMTIGTGSKRRAFKQRLFVINAATYKLILGMDILYFWDASIAIGKKQLLIASSPSMQLNLYTKDYVHQTKEYLAFLQSLDKKAKEVNQISMAEIYEINSVSRIANAIGEVEQEYLGFQLNEILVGTSPSGGIKEVEALPMPLNSRVSYAPIPPHQSNVKSRISSVQQALDFCTLHKLDPNPQDTLVLRAERLSRALQENTQLINPELPPEDRIELLQVFLEFGDLLAFDLSDLKHTADFPSFVIDVTSKPIKSKPYRLNWQDQELIDNEVSQLKGAGMLEDSHSSWLSPTFVVRPSTHRARMVTDYRRVNAVTIKNAYPLPDILQLFDRLSSSRVFTTLDLKSGFYQIKVDPASVPITAMGTDNGLYQFLVVPFGLANAPSHFMHAINHVRQVEVLTAFVEAFVDDLCVHSESFQTHGEHLRKTFTALRKRRHMLAASKIFAGYSIIKLLGHTIGQGEVKMDASKIQAVRDLLPPTTIRQLRAFLGIAGYYRRFISNFAGRTFALTEQLKESDRLEWNAKCQHEFEDIKAALQLSPVLKLPTKDGKFRLYTDYCSYALSAVLQQVGTDKVERVIQYASKKCKPTEAVLASAEGELLAVVFGLSKFRHYLAGRNFDLLTDSAAVTNLRTTRNLSAKLVRWSLLLADFDFQLIHKSGKTHLNADGISRALTQAEDKDESLQYVNEVEVEDVADNASLFSELSDTSDCSVINVDLQPLERSICDTGLALEHLGNKCQSCKQEAVRKLLLTCESCGSQWHPNCINQKKPNTFYWHCDSCLERIKAQGIADATEHEALQQYLAGKRFEDETINTQLASLSQNYQWQRGLLYKLNSEGEARIFPGPARRIPLVDEFHRRYLHMGATRLGEILATTFYWPNLRQQVSEFVQHCLPCQLSNLVFRRRERLQGHLLAVSSPRQGWSMDLASDLTTQSDAKASFLVCVCDYTGYTKLGYLSSRTSKVVAAWYEQNIIFEYGTPLYTRTDQGSEFLGEFKDLLIRYGVKQIYTERAAPWRNGRAERKVRTVKRMLRAVLTAREAQDWPELLPQLQLAVNSAPAKSTGMTPYEMFYGEKVPPMFQPHELVNDKLQSLDQVVPLQMLEQQPQVVQARREAMQQLANTRLAEYNRKLEEQYAGCTHKGAVKAKDHKLQPNMLVAIKNTQRKAWQTTGIGPFIIASIQKNTAMLQSLTTGHVFPEAVENVLPLNLRQGARPRFIHNVKP